MNRLKSVLLKVLLLVFLLTPLCFVNVEAKDSDEVPIKRADGNGYVTYIGSSTQVTIPKEYKLPDTCFRAVWVSAFTSDIAGCVSEDQYKREIMDMLDICEYYNINAVIFHVRVYNDAFYKSKYCNWSRYYNTDPSWDALPWVIEECHRRGIEFHAWMNPYRVSTANSNLNEVAKKFPATNAASNPDNLLSGSSTVILNPGIPEVRTFLINVCMELIENYNVDAINFDDYFYVDADDSLTRAMYNPTGMAKDDWKREQVNLFIKGLSEAMRAFNLKTGRRVQLGIAPSGIWRSAGSSSYVNYDKDGNAITNGSSTTSTFQHYASNLYADTLKWINNEWIDYILPQTYWAIEHGSAGFCDLIDWWDKVVKYKNVNLYASLGLYMRSSSGNSSWSTSESEGYNQVMYANKLENCRGTSVYTFSTLKSSITNTKSFVGVKDLWSKPAILPEVRTMPKITVAPVSGAEVGITEAGYKISFPVVEDGKFYVIYRSEKDITYNPSEVIDIVGGNGYNGIVDFVDTTSDTTKKYNYAIKSQSNSLTLSEGFKFDTSNAKPTSKATLESVEHFLTSYNTFKGEVVVAKWNSVYYSYGTGIEYELEYSKDGKNWEKSNISPIANDGYGRISTTMIIPNDFDTCYVRIHAFNNLAESYSEVFNIPVYENYGDINNLIYSGELYSGKNINLIWNNQLGYDNIKYTIQVSRDDFEYSDVGSINNDPSKTNVSFGLKLEESGRYYYRIKGEVNGMVSFSKPIQLEVKDYFGDITGFKINGKAPEKVYIANEDDEFVVEFDRKESETYSISYVNRISRDGNNWILASNLNSKNKSSVKDGKAYQTIYMTGTEYKYYYYLEVTLGSKENHTEEYIFYCIPVDMFEDEFVSFMKHEQNYLLGLTNIFK